MSIILNNMNSLIKNQKGATAIEYGLIASLISVVILSALAGTGNTVGTLYGENVQEVTDAIEGAR